jgi:hypothetical protein
MRFAPIPSIVAGVLVSGMALQSQIAVAGPGDHIELGNNTLLVPGIGVGFDIRSNAYRSPGEAATGNEADRVEPGVAFRLLPTLGINARAPQVRFAFNGAYDFRKYLTSEQSNLDRFKDFSVKSSLDLFEDGAVGLSIDELATIRSFESEAPELQSALLSQFRNDLGAMLNLRAGSTLSFGMGGSWAFSDYKVPSYSTVSVQDQINSRHEYGPDWEVRWTFFPRTALVMEGEYHFLRWNDTWVSTGAVESNGSGVGDYFAKPNAEHFRTKAGLRGRITERFVGALLVGYGFGTYDESSVTDAASDEPPNNANEALAESQGFDVDVTGLDQLLIEVALAYDIGWGQMISLGYRKDFLDSFFTNYEAYHSLNASLSSEFGARVQSELFVIARFENFYGEVERRDILLRAGGNIDVEMNSWSSISGGVTWLQRASSFEDIQYDDVQFSLMANFTY